MLNGRTSGCYKLKTPTIVCILFGAIGEFERNLIRERVLAGQQRAKANGVKLGRPSKMTDGMKSAVKLLRQKGMGIKQIARELQVGVGTVYSVI